MCAVYRDTQNLLQTYRYLLCLQLARFQHAGDIYKSYLVIFGGETANGTILNDLWLFNTVSLAWSQPVNHSLSSPPGLIGHTANIVEDTLYIFGGNEIGLFCRVWLYIVIYWVVHWWLLHMIVKVGDLPIFRCHSAKIAMQKQAGNAILYWFETSLSLARAPIRKVMFPNKKLYRSTRVQIGNTWKSGT